MPVTLFRCRWRAKGRNCLELGVQVFGKFQKFDLSKSEKAL